MKKIFAITLACSTLAACSNGIPQCNNRDLDGCGYGHAYTEERTYKSAPKMMAAPVVAPAPAPVPEPVFTPPPVAAPAPAPAPVDDAPVMMKADEPDMKK